MRIEKILKIDLPETVPDDPRPFAAAQRRCVLERELVAFVRRVAREFTGGQENCAALEFGIAMSLLQPLGLELTFRGLKATREDRNAPVDAR